MDSQRGCRMQITSEELQIRLNLPPEVTIMDIQRAGNLKNTWSIELAGIGPVVMSGAALQTVSGKVRLDTEGGLKWRFE